MPHVTSPIHPCSFSIPSLPQPAARLPSHHIRVLCLIKQPLETRLRSLGYFVQIDFPTVEYGSPGKATRILVSWAN